MLKTHPNGMRFSAFDGEGDLLATNEYFSVGGGFVVNDKTKVDENLFYKGVDKNVVHGARLQQTHSLSDPTPSVGPTLEDIEITQSDVQGPPYPFESGSSLLALTKKHNMTIAQIVYDNEKSFGYTDDDIHSKIFRIWSVMDECILTGVSTHATTLPGRLGLRRRAPTLYRRLMRGFYPSIRPSSNLERIEAGSMAPMEFIDGPVMSANEGEQGPGRVTSAAPHSSKQNVNKFNRVIGSFDHPLLPHPPRKTMIPAMDFLSCYAIAVNEVNASGGRIVTSPTNGAAGVIPAVLKYIVEFISDDPEKSVMTFLLTAAVCFRH